MGMFSGIKDKVKEGFEGAVAGGILGGVPGAAAGAAAGATQEISKKKKAANFLGRQAADVGGGLITDWRGQRNTKKNFEFLESKGLTPWEIGGSAGGVAKPGTNTLGSGPATQIRSQQNFVAGENAKDRRSREIIAARTAGIGQQGATLNRDKFGEEKRMNVEKRKQINASIAQMKQATTMSKFQQKVFWASKFAGMSAENGMMALAAFAEGIDLENVLTMMGRNTQTIAQANKLYKHLQANAKHFSGEAIGAGTLVNKLVETMGGPNPGTANQKNIMGAAKRSIKKREQANKKFKGGSFGGGTTRGNK